MKTQLTISRPKEYRRIMVRHDVPERKTLVKTRWPDLLRSWIYAESFSENRFKWVGISMVVQAIVITPIVCYVIMLTGNYLVFWFLATAAMYLTFIPSLSGLSAKTVLVTFLAAVIINLFTILLAVGLYLFF
ncbi:MAG TPA: hypothetical protein PKC72_10700 [Chitinophagaceae bacterium]|nr:hypothetical protein [Chitinophagaceae bacterium]